MPHPHFVLKMLPETHQGILVFWALAAWISCQQKLYFSSHHNAMSVDWLYYVQVQFSCSVLFDSLWPHGLQHARFSCPSPAPRAYSNSCPSIQWCHTTISFSVVPFSSCLQSFPASGSSPMSQFFTSGGQSIGVSASASVLPMNIRNWFLSDGLVGSPSCPRDSQESSPTQQFKSINSSVLSFLHSPTLTSIHDYWKSHSFD